MPGHRGGAQRVPEHRDVAAAAAVRALVARRRRRPRPPCPAGRAPCSSAARTRRLGAAGGAQQDAEDQPVPDDDLLDVEHGHVVGRSSVSNSADVTPGRSRPVTVTSSAPAVLWFLSMTGQRYCRARPGRRGPPGIETEAAMDRARGQGRCGDRGRGRHRSGGLPGAGRRGYAGGRGLPAGPGGGRRGGRPPPARTSPRRGPSRAWWSGRSTGTARWHCWSTTPAPPRSGTASCPPPTTTGCACSRST